MYGTYTKQTVSNFLSDLYQIHVTLSSQDLNPSRQYSD